MSPGRFRSLPQAGLLLQAPAQRLRASLRRTVQALLVAVSGAVWTSGGAQPTPPPPLTTSAQELLNRFVELATTTPTRPFIEDRFSVKFIETKRLPDAISYSGSPEPASSPSPLQFQAITLHQFTTGGTVTIETRRLDRQWAGSASECVRIGHLMLALGAAWTVKRRPAHPDYSYVATIGGKERELWIEPDFPAAVGDCIQSFSVRYHIVAALEAFPALQSQTLNHGSVSTTDPFDLCVRGIN